MSGSRGHWEDVYTAKSEKAVSWYQPHALRSLERLRFAAFVGLVLVAWLGEMPPVDDFGSLFTSIFSHSFPAPPACAASEGMWT